MLKLGAEIFYSICDLLGGQSLLELSLTSYRFYDLLKKKDMVWKKRYEDEFQLSLIKPKHRSWKNVYYSSVYAPLCLFRQDEEGWSRTELGLPENRQWVQIASTLSTLYALDQTGQLWSLDHCKNKPFQTGVTWIKELIDNPRGSLKPIQSQARFVSISTYFYHCLGLTQDNRLCRIQGGRVQRLPGQFSARPRQILSHGDLALILSDQYALCFVGDKTRVVPWGEDWIVTLASLQTSILALTASGRLWKLNTENMEALAARPEEHRVELVHFSGAMPRTIHANYDSFAVCTDSGKVWMGASDVCHDSIPIQLDFLQNRGVNSVSFGCGHNAAWTKTGEVITWRIADGVQKVERNEDVELISKNSLHQGRALQVAFGFKHNFAALVMD